MAKNILITGGSGLIGKRLTTLLIERGYNVAWLSRSEKTDNSSVQVFNWNIESGAIDKAAIIFADAIISLAGAGIADKPWTEKRKQEIIHSRVDGINLLAEKFKNAAKKIEVFVSASAIGYYGDCGETVLKETDPPTNEFLSVCCQKWERAVDRFSQLGVRTVKIRTGMVLAKEGGALPKIAKPVKLGFGAALGKGDQWMSWIHIDDLCELYIAAIENRQMTGPFNASASHPVTNKEFTKLLAKQLNKPLWLPNVPEFALKLFLGELSKILLDSSKCSNNKTIQSGFRFKFDTLEEAFKAIYQ